MKKRLLSWFLSLAFLGVAVGYAFIYSGFYDVSATDGHTRVVERILRKTMENSIRYHSRDIAIPSGMDMKDPVLAEKAIGHYSVACATCHGAPGAERAPWMVIYPEAPLLTDHKVVAQWKDQELYWVIKNGIKDTGMMALGPTHPENDIWAVTAFVRQLPEMTAQRYGDLLKRYKEEKSQHRH